ncbi:DUF559 domain-containing protein [Pseudokineococcus sp. 1T1Z-3]|uniref:DUF559 domain-containing protein n=1 Tax=Pseudokineococcus sp. 1T1Z-3 TaxID=3132745 RepID=UPI0030A95B4D
MRWRSCSTSAGAVVADLFGEQTRLVGELDGRRYHDGPQQRERDLTRDARLAELGIQTLRFSHQRLTTDPGGCREQLLRVHAARRRRLAAPVS